MPKCKLLFIHHCGTKSGAANSLINLIRFVNREQFHCVVLCPPGSAFDAFKNVSDEIFPIPELPEIISISGYPHNYLRVFKAVLLYAKLNQVVPLVDRIKPDIIHLNEISLSPLARKLKAENRKIVFHARVVLDRRTKLLNAYIINNINKYADHTICIDESVRNLLKGVKKSSVVYNSYQFDQSELKETSNPSKTKFIALFLANLIKYKGVFDLLEAAKLLKDHPDIEIQIAGGNSRPDEFFTSFKGRLLSWLGLAKNNRVILQQKIDHYQLNANIRLIGNIHNVREKILESSVNIFPSYMDGPSRSIFEAGVLGRPSIISLYHKINDVVEDGVTGLVIDERNPRQIAQAILRFKEDKDFYHKVCNNAKLKYFNLNNPIENAKKVEHIYLQILKESN